MPVPPKIKKHRPPAARGTRGATRNPDLMGAARIANVSAYHAHQCLEGHRKSLRFVRALESAGHPLAKKARAAL